MRITATTEVSCSSRFTPLWLLVIVSVLCATTAADAQGFSVSGTGSAPFEAKRLVVRGSLTQESEDAGDALKNLQTKLTRVERACKEIVEELEGFELRRQGIVLDATNPQAAQMGVVMMGGMEGQSMTPKVSASCDLLFVVPTEGLDATGLADAVGRVHAAARDLDVKFVGGGINPEMIWALTLMGQQNKNTPDPIFYFEVADGDALEEAAFAAAFADAKRRAESQAKAAGVGLGKVTSVKTLTGANADKQATQKGQHEVTLEVVFGVGP